MPQRPDWEHVVPGMIELVAGLPEVDARRIVLVGRSFGGVLAPRGAAGAPQLAALIVDTLGIRIKIDLPSSLDKSGAPP